MLPFSLKHTHTYILYINILTRITWFNSKVLSIRMLAYIIQTHTLHRYINVSNPSLAPPKTIHFTRSDCIRPYIFRLTVFDMTERVNMATLLKFHSCQLQISLPSVIIMMANYAPNFVITMMLTTMTKKMILTINILRTFWQKYQWCTTFVCCLVSFHFFLYISFTNEMMFFSLFHMTFFLLHHFVLFFFKHSRVSIYIICRAPNDMQTKLMFDIRIWCLCDARSGAWLCVCVCVLSLLPVKISFIVWRIDNWTTAINTSNAVDFISEKSLRECKWQGNKQQQPNLWRAIEKINGKIRFKVAIKIKFMWQFSQSISHRGFAHYVNHLMRIVCSVHVNSLFLSLTSLPVMESYKHTNIVTLNWNWMLHIVH